MLVQVIVIDISVRHLLKLCDWHSLCR